MARTKTSWVRPTTSGSSNEDIGRFCPITLPCPPWEKPDVAPSYGMRVRSLEGSLQAQVSSPGHTDSGKPDHAEI